VTASSNRKLIAIHRNKWHSTNCRQFSIFVEADIAQSDLCNNATCSLMNQDTVSAIKLYLCRQKNYAVFIVYENCEQSMKDQ